MDKIARIKELTRRLNEYRHAYYNHNHSLVSDSAYDELFDELTVLEEETGFILANSPTQTVGYEVITNFTKVEHPIPLLSLAKTKSVDELADFTKGQDCLLMHKLDGLTVECVYEGGKLVQASTRGDGKVGEDITHNALVFANVPKTIAYPNRLRIAGEAIIFEEDFKRINESLAPGEKPYANQRNLASGSVRQLDSKICADRNVHWIPWDVLEGFEEWHIENRFAKLKELHTLGFDTPAFFSYVDSVDRHKLPDMIETLRKEAKNHGIPIDGLVMKFNDLNYSKAQGGTSHHNNDGLAFKFEDETATTTLRNIEWSLGRTGVFTPVAVFDPVELEGTTVERASVHNLGMVIDLQLCIGDEIIVYKANAIIPQILRNNTKHTVYHTELPITRCPHCGEKIEVVTMTDTTNLCCVNPDCKGKLLYKLSYFVSKPAMNIDGLSEATLERFIENGWLNTYADIYRLSEHKNEILLMDNFGERSYEKLIEAIEKSKTTTLDRVLVAIGIPNIGKSASKEISRLCNGDPEEFLNLLKHYYDFTQLPDFGQIMSDSIHDFFANANHLTNFIDLLSFLQISKQQSIKIGENPLSGKVAVVTGTLQSFSRDEVHEILEKLGAKPSGSISKKTDYLIAGEKAGSKLQKAKDLGVKVLTEDEFKNLISSYI